MLGMPKGEEASGGSASAPKQPSSSSESSASHLSPSHQSGNVSSSDAVLSEILKELRELRMGYQHLDSKIEAVSLEMQSPLPKFTSDQSPLQSSFREPNHRQSLGSYHSTNSLSSQELVVRKNSFRLDKPKYEAPKDTSIDGALMDSVIKFFEDCDRYIEAWKVMAENKDKPFEGEHNFALLSLPAPVQREVAHSLDMIFSPAETVLWTVEELEEAVYWKRARTTDIRHGILARKAQGVSNQEAIKTIQYPAIAFPRGVGLIHLEAFETYKTQLVTQVSRLAEGGTVLPLVAVKDAIIAAIPDPKFRSELYSLYGNSGCLPGPTAAGDVRAFSIRQIFARIRQHIMTIKKVGLADVVNRNSLSRGMTHDSVIPPSRNFGGAFSASHKFGNRETPSRFPARAVQAIELDHEFPETDRTFWSGAHAEAEISADDSDEFHQINAMIQQVKSKECRYKGIGPDGKVLCPYLGNPETAKCGFIHPSKELELKGKGVSKSTPAHPKKVHNVSGGLEIPYAADFSAESDVERSDL